MVTSTGIAGYEGWIIKTSFYKENENVNAASGGGWPVWSLSPLYTYDQYLTFISCPVPAFSNCIF